MSLESVKVFNKKLIHKLTAYGVRGNMLNWMEAILKARKYCVFLGDVESELEDVTSSVLQGSVLCPFLFVVFIKDLLYCLVNECKMYADKNNVIAVNKPRISDGLQLDIDKTVEWCKTWSMSLNDLI